MAQLIIAAAGAAVTASFPGIGGALAGLAVSTLGNALFAPSQKSVAPKLDDGRVTGTEYGQPIPLLFGHPRTAGQMIYSSLRRAIKNTQEVGKGGPSASSTTWTYEFDCIILLSDNEIAGVRRIWEDGKLIYTAADDATADSLSASATTEKWRRMTVYTGSATQMPDPTYEADVGTAFASANRGRGTVAFEGFQLGSNGTMRNLTFEVSVTGGGTAYATSLLYAPLTTNEADIVSPAATATYTNAGQWSFDATNGARVVSLPSTSTDVQYASSKLLHVTHPGVDVTAMVDATILSVSGSGTRNDNRFITVSDLAGNTASFSHRMVSDAIVLRTNVTTTASGTSITENCPYTPTTANYRIVFEADEAHVAFYVDDVLVRRAVFPRLNGPSVVVNLIVLAWGFGGVSSYYFKDLRYYYGSVPVTTTVFPRTPATLQSVVEALSDRAGMTGALYSASALSTITTPVRALSISQISPLRQIFESILAPAYFFTATLSDKLYYKPEQKTSVLTIDWSELGAAASADSGAEPFARKMLYDMEQPAQLTMTYVDVDADYNVKPAHSMRVGASQGSNRDISLALGLQAAEAKGIVDRKITDIYAKLFGTQLSMLIDKAKLEPGDVVDVVDRDGSHYLLNLTKRTDSRGILQFDAELTSAIVQPITGTTSTYTSTSVVTPPADTVFHLLDIPTLRDADDGLGLYVAAYGSSIPWPGYGLFKSPDSVTWSARQNGSSAASVGITTTALTAWASGNVWDHVSTVTVFMRHGTLSSYTMDQVLEGAAPGYLIGS